MDTKLLGVLGLGTLAMMGVMIDGHQYYKEITVWKGIVSAIILTIAGVLGAKLMYVIENGGRYGGTSFYGAVFLAPIVMAILAFLLRINGRELLDLCAPSECVMLVALKVLCQINGCCYGRILFQRAGGEEVRFPSQIAEAANGVILFLILEFLIRKRKWSRNIYPIYLILYGITRFGLNWFRDTEAFIAGLPAGNFWSLVAIGTGGIWLSAGTRRRKVQTDETK